MASVSLNNKKLGCILRFTLIMSLHYIVKSNSWISLTKSTILTVLMIWIELFKLFNKFCLLAYCAPAPLPPQVDWATCDCVASSAPFTNIQTYLLTYLYAVKIQNE